MKPLADLSREQMRALAAECGHPAFRGAQLYDWVTKGADFSAMRNLPPSFTDALRGRDYIAQAATIVERRLSAGDGTIKFLYRLRDGNVIEGVLMKYEYGSTLCVSTQVGCRMGCAFCASGIGGLIRNLSAGEILGQILAVNADAGRRVVNRVVLMGSGEPLDNYDNTTAFVRLITAAEGLNFSPRLISLSTCGLCPRIRALADEGYGVVLTVSLHAPDDEKRRRIMPVAKRFTVREIADAARYYFRKTGRRVIFEYALIRGFNDGAEDADALAALVRGFPCLVNLIPLNDVPEHGLRGTGRKRAYAFAALLAERGLEATVRRTMGADIEGACGQLRRSYLKDGAVGDNEEEKGD